MRHARALPKLVGQILEHIETCAPCQCIAHAWFTFQVQKVLAWHYVKTNEKDDDEDDIINNRKTKTRTNLLAIGRR